MTIFDSKKKLFQKYLVSVKSYVRYMDSKRLGFLAVSITLNILVLFTSLIFSSYLKLKNNSEVTRISKKYQ
jgi:hypothetical protein